MSTVGSASGQEALSASDHAPHDRRRWYALLILSLSLTLVIMDGTIVNVAIPRSADSSMPHSAMSNG